MCDTLVLRQQGVSWLAKNSDREAAEPQRLIRLPAVRGDTARQVRATYVEVAQTADRHAVILSQPSWIWGAEMGVNEHGLAIGNEAVFTRLTAKKGEALLGMDLLRLALERAATAREGIAVLTEQLQRYGQAGAGGYRDKQFRYDSSFLLADPNEAWVLETAGKLWAAKRVERWAISNALSLGCEFDLSSPDLPGEARRLGCWNGRGDFHFARAFDTRLLPWIGGAHQRRALNQQFLSSCPATAGWGELAAALRNHGSRHDDFERHNNRQVCMHAGRIWRPSQTTASLIARLAADGPRMAATATSAPCMSLFQPLGFAEGAGADLLSAAAQPLEQSRWWRFESVHRRALGDAEFRQALQASRDLLEPRLLEQLQLTEPDWPRLQQEAQDWHRHWQQLAEARPPVLNRWWQRQAQL
ncbi:C69 family dipeptidase [Pseudomonas sp. N040]|uniref:C69 family dipeptidase n=1 Tax=Pseudomonas sp. N040 TaxID=2785325 RepID=UPI0018A303D9|nr:C69 family dipeptidase [Pseudomonas sp. N040]MBF7731210.1 C69 family dipeptidase [Pseudomonas sp. N040]MBW7014853.1 C69 family dipeptidase [Pseudomonas sp. N040]